MTTNRDKGWAGETNTKWWPKARLEGKQGPWSFCRRIFVSILLMDQQGTSWAFSVRNNIIKPVSSETCSGCTVGMIGLAQGCNQPELLQFELNSELSQGRGDRERSCWGILDTKTQQDRMMNWVKVYGIQIFRMSAFPDGGDIHWNEDCYRKPRFEVEKIRKFIKMCLKCSWAHTEMSSRSFNL